jgi:hypothetical protein
VLSEAVQIATSRYTRPSDSVTDYPSGKNNGDLSARRVTKGIMGPLRGFNTEIHRMVNYFVAA